MTKIPINSHPRGSEGAGNRAEKESRGEGVREVAEQQSDGGAPVLESESHPDSTAGSAPDAPKAEADETEKFKKLSEEYLDTLRRMQADFENYRKRVKREKAETVAFATEGIVKKLLGVADNLDRGIACAEDESKCGENLLDGIRLVRKQFLDVLSEYGAAPFEAAGKPFDPTLHECLYVLEREDLPEGTVVEELERGFRMGERVLRAAKVSVSRKKQ